MKNFQKKINLVYDALHGMAYYIFQKSLRSLEEFRENLHVKIPPKSPSTIFQSLAIIKN
jgi:phosphomannomutase